MLRKNHLNHERKLTSLIMEDIRSTDLIPASFSSFIINLMRRDDKESLIGFVGSYSPKRTHIELENAEFTIFSSSPSLIFMSAFFRAENCFDFLTSIWMPPKNYTERSLTLSLVASAGNFIHFFEEFEWNTEETGIFDEQQVNLMDIAAAFGSTEVLKYILSKEKSLKTKALDYTRPLFIASRYGHLETVKYLHQIGSSLIRRNLDRETILDVACKEGHHDLVKYLLKYVDISTHPQVPTIIHAVRSGDLKTVKELLTVTPCSYIKGPFQPLIEASKIGAIDIVKFLLHQGVDINARDSEGKTAFYVSIERGDEKLFSYLVKRGCKPIVDEKFSNQMLTKAQLTNRGVLLNCQVPENWENLNETPDKIQILIGKLDGMGMNFRQLTKEIRHRSSIGAPLYVASRTSPLWSTQQYVCAYNKRLSCPSFIEFKIVDGKVYISKYLHLHNHSFASLNEERMFYHRVDDETKRIIIEATRQGLSVGQIRTKYNITIPPNDLYNIRRAILEEERRKDEVAIIKKLLRAYDGWSMEFNRDNSNCIFAVHAVFLPVARSPYASFQWYTDETSCTNFSGYSVSVIVTKDCNGKTQTLAFCLLKLGSAEILARFYQYVLSLCEERPQAIIVDRGKSQLSAIEEVFPDVPIVFCYLHIRRNIANAFGHNKEEKTFLGIIRQQVTEDDGLHRLQSLCEKASTSKKKKCLQHIIEKAQYWLPSVVMKVTDDFTTNRIEEVFGKLKNMLGHNLVSVSTVCGALMNLSEMRLKESLRMRTTLIDNNIMAEDQQIQVGKVALDLLQQEFSGENREKQICLMEVLYKLPCLHHLPPKDGEAPIIDIKVIPERWLRRMFYQRESSILSEKRRDVENSSAYSQYSEAYDPFFSLAKTMPKVRDILDSTLETLNSLGVFKDGVNGFVEKSVPGKPFTHPRMNCEPDLRRKREHYRCSICKKLGHNRATCPNKQVGN